MNYQDLLKKFMAHVSAEESVNFVNKIHMINGHYKGLYSGVEFTDVEMSELYRLQKIVSEPTE